MNINLKLLHTFLLVAEHNSFRQAGTYSGRSQSAVSTQIKQLEKQLGISLFHRTTRRVQLTKAGEELLRHARKAVAELEAGLSHIRGAIDLLHGRLSVACVPTIAATRLPHALVEFQKQNPGITVFVRELIMAELLESVRRQEVDFGIGPEVQNQFEFKFSSLFHDRACVVFPAKYDAPQTEGVSLDQVSKWPMISLSPSSAFRVALDEVMCARNIRMVDSKYEFRQVETIVAMVAAGLGAAILPEIPLRNARTGNLKILPIIDPPIGRTIGVITLRGQALSPAAQRLVALLESDTDNSVKE